MNFADWIRRRGIYRRIRLIRLPRIRGIKAPTFIVILVWVAAAIFLLGGIIYNYTQWSSGSLVVVTNYNGQPVFYYPSDISKQLLGESLLSMTFYVIGIVGCYIAFQSTRYAYRRRQAWMLLSSGIALIVIAYLGLEVLYKLKLG
jgi:hypothetical protein